MAKKRSGISEKEFVEAVRELYPNALLHELDEKDLDDVWIRGIGFCTAARIGISACGVILVDTTATLRTLMLSRNGLRMPHANNRKFEEISEVVE